MAPEAAKKDPNELVSIKAPGSDETAQATRHAFETLYKEQGYTLVEPKGAGASAAPAAADTAKAGDK